MHFSTVTGRSLKSAGPGRVKVCARMTASVDTILFFAPSSQMIVVARVRGYRTTPLQRNVNGQQVKGEIHGKGSVSVQEGKGRI